MFEKFKITDRIVNEVSIMRYITTIFWSVLLVNMLTYVRSSMAGLEYDPKGASIIGVAVGILVSLIAMAMGGKEGYEPEQNHK